MLFNKCLVRRLSAGLLAVLMLVGLCACGGDATPTTTTAGEETTTTVADDVTTTVADDVTTTEGDEVTTTVGDEQPTAKPTQKPTQKPVATTTVTKVTTSRERPWADATTTAKPSTTEKQYATLPNIQRNPEYDNPHGVYHTLLSYTQPGGGEYSKSQWLPSVGYVKDGQVQGVFYDSFIILPSPNFIYYGALTTKGHWDTWRRHTYKNLDTLNEAVAEVQEALNLKEYKVKIFTSIWMPSIERNSNWGVLNGAAIGAKNDEERFQMVKYMIDSYVSEIAEKNYSNLEFAGFYWFDESLNTNKGVWYKQVFEYVNSVDLITVWAPYYISSGWNYGATYGIDLVAMQSNHFHSTPVGSMNCGSIARLEANAKRVARKETNGITVECSTAEDRDDITTLKMTMEAALKHGTDSAYHIYYYGGGAKAPYSMSRSSDEYIRSAYDELYKYMNHTLTLEDLWIRDFEKEQPWPDGVQDYL